ncbi:MAG: hypothetical protein ACI4EN_06660 [Butyrivibrio sp.]
MKKKTKKNKILTAAITALLCVLFLTTAVYAWFSMTNAPKVSNLVLRAGTAGNLQISNERDTGYSDSITLELDGDCCLRPLTTIDGVNFYRPVYGNDGVVESIAPSAITPAEMEGMINAVESEGGWLIKKTFYLKADGSGSDNFIDIKLMSPIGTRESGTVIRDATEDTYGAEAVRISFTYNGTTGILEPNADVTSKEADASQVSLPGWNNMPVIKQGSDNYFSADGGRTYTQGVSEELFRIPVGEPAEVTMYIWLEGADKECVNSIMGSSVEIELRFISEDIN